MKKKFLVLTLCFTLIFSSFNYKKSYADGGVISLPILATVSALAVGTGIIINNNDDLYDIGRMFYDYVDKHNTLTWETVQSVFSACVSLQPNKLVSVKSEFLDLVKGFFDDTFTDTYVDGYYGVFPNLISYKSSEINKFLNSMPTVTPTYGQDFSVGGVTFKYDSFTLNSVTGVKYYKYFYDSIYGLSTGSFSISDSYTSLKFYIGTVAGDHRLCIYGYNNSWLSVSNGYIPSQLLIYDFPYSGGYTWDNVDSRKENESVSLPVPGNLGVLVGQGSTDFWDNSNGLVGSGNISIPNVDNPSIDFDDIVSFPNTNVDTDVPGVDSPSVPNEGIWATIKEFIIGLVVPNDTYWTDTWGGLYDNFTNSFPMVDMDGFNDLVTGEKKFPNIDINIMGVNGRVVNGDVINSIVDWLRPIIAGFMMLCLMLFNYRKIYKLIRNSEPFGGIAPGTSDFKTGISEYNKEPVIKAVDMASEYRAWKENGGK